MYNNFCRVQVLHFIPPSREQPDIQDIESSLPRIILGKREKMHTYDEKVT